VSVVDRPARVSDAEAIADLMRACDATYEQWLPRGWTPPEVGAELTTRFMDPDRWSLAVEEDGELVGFASFRQAHDDSDPGVRSGPPLAGVAHVGAVFVRPSHWRRGIAARMLSLAEDEMRARGFRRAVLWTPDGAPAERFYLAQGWERDGRRAWHRWMGLGVVGYAKRL
jgi:GNAT superfamily N-acetyltransferase